MLLPLCAGYTWCPSRNACFPSADGLTASGAACCSDWTTDDQCAGDMSCTLTGAAAVCDCAAGKNFCVARSTCLTPYTTNSQLEDVACCPDASWPSAGTDECKGTMTCSSTTKTCTCPTAGQHWCDARDECRAPLAPDAGAPGAACCPTAGWAETNECAGDMTCSAGSKTCSCTTGEQLQMGRMCLRGGMWWSWERCAW